MYKISWDSEVNGILLNDTVRDKNEIMPPRPVFHEELNLLGFQQYWTFSESDAPLLWAIGRGYYQNGRLIGEALGGNLYEAPKLVIHHETALTPLNLDLLIERNKEALSICEDEAKDFAQSVYKTYRGKVDYFAVAFSGGKDSQVILDIVSQVLAPDEYLVIFTDTTMEIPFTYDTFEETKQRIKNSYPDLKFHKAYPPKEAAEFWEMFGSPSRLHRWCCSVCKTAPFAKGIKELHKQQGKKGMPKILVFEGVRSDESVIRSKYQRLVKGLKHANQRNARVIFNWNTSEVFLHLFKKEIPLNKGYRYGLNRVGCSLCPFSRGWSDFILISLFPNLSNKFVNIIKKGLLSSGFTNEKHIEEYLKEEQWKKRGGGKYIDVPDGARVDFTQKDNGFKCIIRNPREVFFEWLNVVGDVWYKRVEQCSYGEVKIDDHIVDFTVEESQDNVIVIDFPHIQNDITAQSKLKRIAYKTTYCVHCGVCEIECPAEALQVIPKVKVEKELCIHCSNCLNFVEKGCLVAKSLTESLGGKYMETKKRPNPDRYRGFGMKKEWLESFLDNSDKWLEKNPLSLGPKQLPSIKIWLKEAGLADEHNVPTKLLNTLNTLRTKYYMMIWQIIWTNLSYNSPLIEWYTTVKFGKYTKQELNDLIKIDFPEHGERTLSNAIDALVYMLDYSPLGNDLKLGVITKKGKAVQSIEKRGLDEIHPMMIAYSLYCYAEQQQRYDLIVSEFYEEQCQKGHYKLFGISKEVFENTLRFLQEERNQVVRVDLQADLENIFLRDDIKSTDILTMI